MKNKMKPYTKSILILLLIIVSCLIFTRALSEGQESSAHREIFAMDTYMTLTAYGEKCEAALDEAEAFINRMDTTLSAQNEKSEIFKLNKEGVAFVSEDTLNIIKKACEISQETDGALDITIYPVVKEWGFFDDKLHVPSDEELSKLLLSVDYHNIEIADKAADGGLYKISLKNKAAVDPGAIAKGYTSEKVMDILKKYELTGAIVSLGGNIQCCGRRPDGSDFVCGITDPKRPDSRDSLLGTIKVSDKAIVTSGTYERFLIDDESGEKYHHIINPQTGLPAENEILSVTIVSKDGTVADALSTACFVMGREKAISFYQNSPYDFDMVIMTMDEQVYITNGLSDAFSSQYDYEIIEK